MRLTKKLEGLREIPEQAIQAAHSVVQAEIPVYTGTYQAAVTVADVGEVGVYTGVALMIDEGDLQASAEQHAVEIEEKTGLSPSDYVGDPPYPLHIEPHGSPRGLGIDMWKNAAEEARAVVREAVARLA